MNLIIENGNTHRDSERRNKMKNLLTIKFLAVSLVFSGVCHGAPEKPFYKQNESAQHFVLEKGQEFRLFQYNSIIMGSGAKYDNKIKFTDTASFRIHDESDKTNGGFRQHHPMWVSPCTEYLLEYMVKVDKIEGPGPYVELILHDYNTDRISTLQYPVSLEGPTDGWVKKQASFKTDYLTYEIMLQLSSDNKGTCDVYFDKVYFRQISEAGSLMPTPIPLMADKSAKLGDSVKNEISLGSSQLPLTRKYIRMDFCILWQGFEGNASLQIDWIDDYGRTLANDYCEIYRIKGIEPDGNGIATRWKQSRGQTTDKCSFKLDWHFNKEKAGGNSSVEYTMQVPKNARTIQINILKENDFEGTLYISNLNLIAEY
jgi:hypothetical protein